jgi:hypothetical protein
MTYLGTVLVMMYLISLIMGIHARNLLSRRSDCKLSERELNARAIFFGWPFHQNVQELLSALDSSLSSRTSRNPELLRDGYLLPDAEWVDLRTTRHDGVNPFSEEIKEALTYLRRQRGVPGRMAQHEREALASRIKELRDFPAQQRQLKIDAGVAILAEEHRELEVRIQQKMELYERARAEVFGELGGAQSEPGTQGSDEPDNT